MGKRLNIGVVGGGLLGMTVAGELSAKGHKVSLFESSTQLGGLAASSVMGDFNWDKYYHVILLSDAYTRKLIDDLDLSSKLNWVETKTGFYTDGKLFSMSNTMEFLKFPPLGLMGKLRLGFTIFYASRVKNWKKLEMIYVGPWLKRLSGKQTYEKIWLPLLRAKLGELYKVTSAAFIWATIQRMYAARRSGLKKEMFGYVEGGYACILEAYQKKLLSQGVRTHTSHELLGLKSKKGSGIRAIFDKKDTQVYDKLVLCLPSSVIPELKMEMADAEIQKHKNIQYMGVICLAVVLKKPVSPFYVTNITDAGLPFTGIIEMSALVNPSHLKANHLVYLPKYLAREDAYFNASDEEITDAFLSSFYKMYPHIKPADVKYSCVARSRNVFAIPGIGHSDNLPPLKSAIDDLYILNSAHIINGTLNVNETIKLAKQSAKLIHQEHDVHS